MQEKISWWSKSIQPFKIYTRIHLSSKRMKNFLKATMLRTNKGLNLNHDWTVQQQYYGSRGPAALTSHPHDFSIACIRVPVVTKLRDIEDYCGSSAGGPLIVGIALWRAPESSLLTGSPCKGRLFLRLFGRQPSTILWHRSAQVRADPKFVFSTKWNIWLSDSGESSEPGMKH